MKYKKIIKGYHNRIKLKKIIKKVLKRELDQKNNKTKDKKIRKKIRNLEKENKTKQNQ